MVGKTTKHQLACPKMISSASCLTDTRKEMLSTSSMGLIMRMVHMTTSEVIISIKVIISIEVIISAWLSHVDSQRTISRCCFYLLSLIMLSHTCYSSQSTGTHWNYLGVLHKQINLSSQLTNHIEILEGFEMSTHHSSYEHYHFSKSGVLFLEQLGPPRYCRSSQVSDRHENTFPSSLPG